MLIIVLTYVKCFSWDISLNYFSSDIFSSVKEKHKWNHTHLAFFQHFISKNKLHSKNELHLSRSRGQRVKCWAFGVPGFVTLYIWWDWYQSWKILSLRSLSQRCMEDKHCSFLVSDTLQRDHISLKSEVLLKNSINTNGCSIEARNNMCSAKFRGL